jgi:teichuronic acid biosynthesis protein TuaE
MKNLIYIMIASSFVSTQFFAIDLGAFQLTICRSLLILLSILIVFRYAISNKKIKLTLFNSNNVFFRFHFIWFIYAIITLIWVKDYLAWFKAVYFISVGLFNVFLIPQFIKCKKDFLIVFGIILIMIAIHNITGWYEIYTLDYKFVDLARLDRYDVWASDISLRVPISTMFNPNDFALVMALGVFIAYICFSNASSAIWKLLSSATLVSCIILCFQSNSRASILGMIIGIILFLILKLKKNRRIVK